MASSQPPQTDAPAQRPGLLETLAQKHKAVALTLAGVAAAFAVLAIILAARAEMAPKATWSDILDPVFFWAVASAAAFAVVAAGCFSPTTGQRLGETERMRLMLLILGATFGILTAVLGMTLPFTQGYSSVFVGGAEEWHKGMGRILVVALALLAGLVLAFASLQLARGVERENALMRRLLYGFTAVFTTLLLLAVLLLINLLPYIPNVAARVPFLTATYDWTKSRLYTLSDRSRATLAGLKEPIKAYVFLDSGDPVGDETITLLRNCRGVTQQVSLETISSLDRKRIQELAKEYQEKIVEDQPDQFGRGMLRAGVLLIYGEKPKERATFVPREQLSKEQPTPDGSSREIFTGEAVLLKAIRSMAESKIVVYFTQGNGEYELTTSPPKANGLDLLQQKIKQSDNFDLKPLTFGPETTEVPKDADEVVLAQPGKLKPEALKALASYMGYEYHEADGSFSEAPGGRKGRLIVLAGAALANKQMVHSGLEPLLAKFGVQLGDDRVLALEDRSGTPVAVQTSPNSGNPVARAFGPPDETIFQFDQVRTAGPAAAGGPFVVDELVVTADPQVWVDTNLATNPSDLVQEKAKDPRPRFSPTPVSVGVAVSERGSMPNDPFHAGLGGQGGPRLVVFGSSTWVVNAGQLGGWDGLKANANLFSSCVSWLRGEPDVGAAPEDVDENKVRPRVDLNLRADTFLATMLLPVAHMALAVAAAACGVWLVRRR